jgi:membrane protease YdiL (CAAX protease family)
MRMTASATFCPNCGQEVFGKRHRLRLEPPGNPNFSDRLNLQGGNASRLLVTLLATLVGTTTLITVFFDFDGAGMLMAGIALAIATVLCTLPEINEIRPLFRSQALLRFWPWAIALCITPLLPLIADLWIDLLGIEKASQEDYMPDFTPGMALLTICIMPGIFEELAFRGVIFGNLKHMLTPKRAQILTAALFAGIHFNPLLFPYHLLIGLFFGLLRTRSGTLLVPMFAHALHNFFVVFVYDTN